MKTQETLAKKLETVARRNLGRLLLAAVALLVLQGCATSTTKMARPWPPTPPSHGIVDPDPMRDPVLVPVFSITWN
jgi:hypothetical protein